MNGVTVDPVRKRAIVQAGARWRLVDREAQVHGLATTGGTVSDTGVAGLTLGGGIGWLMRSAGVTVDNVISIDAVTVDGRSIRISRNDEPDLFWGMLGAGANFAIATSFEFQLHPVGPLVNGGLIAYRGGDAKLVLSAWRDLMLPAPRELSSMANVMRAPVAPIFPEELQGEYVLTILVAYTGPPRIGRRKCLHHSGIGTRWWTSWVRSHTWRYSGCSRRCAPGENASMRRADTSQI